MSREPAPPRSYSALQRWLRSCFHRELAHVFRVLCIGQDRIVQIGGDGKVAERVGKKAFLVTEDASEFPPDKTCVTDMATLEGVETLSPGAVLIPDALPALRDVQATLESIARRIEPRDRLMIAVYSSLWDTVYRLAEKLGLKARSRSRENWVHPTDLENFLRLTGFQVVRRIPVLLCPVRLPLIDWFLNRIVVRLPVLRHLAMLNIYVARLHRARGEYSVSILIPARNERDNLVPMLDELPRLGTKTELIVVEGHSTDGTYEKALELRDKYGLVILKQRGVGKADAVRCGFEVATGDVLYIYDADRTVPVEELERFYEVISSGDAEFANGTRLVYPMEDQSMRFFNKLGNRAFTLLLAYILDYPIRDTLCGTKVLFREDYLKLRQLMDEWSAKDPFGDFDLLFGARQLNLAVIDIPVHYRSRKYGDTNISRWRDGAHLGRLCWEALRRMVFF
jgi:hypothetical protein